MVSLELSLSNEELTLIKNTLEYRIKEIRDELVHTKNRQFHEALKKDLEQLEILERRLRALRLESAA